MARRCRRSPKKGLPNLTRWTRSRCPRRAPRAKRATRSFSRAVGAENSDRPRVESPGAEEARLIHLAPSTGWMSAAHELWLVRHGGSAEKCTLARPPSVPGGQELQDGIVRLVRRFVKSKMRLVGRDEQKLTKAPCDNGQAASESPAPVFEPGDWRTSGNDSEPGLQVATAMSIARDPSELRNLQHQHKQN